MIKNSFIFLFRFPMRKDMEIILIRAENKKVFFTE